MDSNILAAIARSREALESPVDNGRSGRWHRCASDVYFAVFYAAGAALTRRGISSKKHSQTQSEFNKEFVRTGVIDIESGRVYNQLFELRLRMDYEMSVVAEEADVAPLIEPARALVERLIVIAVSEAE